MKHSKENTPDVLYKFRGDIQRDVRCLLIDRELYFSSPEDLNDPFDCYPSIQRPPQGKWHELVELEVSYSPHGEDETRRAKASSRLYASDEYLAYLRDHIYQEVLCRKLGVLSMSATRDHPLLWTHYANNCRGFAVGYKFSNSDDVYDMALGYVDYLKVRPTIFPIGDHNWSIILATKSKHWDHEEEWRYLRTADLGGHGHMAVPEGSITEVCLGPRMEDADAAHVYNAAMNLQDKPSIYQAKLKCDGYGLDFDRIN